MAANTTVTTERARPSSLGGLAIVAASIVLSIASSFHLGNTVRIRWTVGTYQHYGPEYVSTLPVLVAFPVVLAGLYAGIRLLGTYLKRSGAIDDFDDVRAVYDVFALVLLGSVVAGQLVVIALNL